MFTEPRIVNPQNLHQRAYVLTYVNGVRHRIYNGSMLNSNCFPNRCSNIRDREKALIRLQFLVRKQLEKGWMPGDEKSAAPVCTKSAVEALANIQEWITKEAISEAYLRDLSSIVSKLRAFLTSRNLNSMPIEQIGPLHLRDFLQQFETSPTNYMNKRRTLSSLFARLLNRGVVQVNPVAGTKRVKEAHQLHLAFKWDQLQEVLQFIEKSHSQLYLCCLLMYGCMLRPHREIRLLKKSNFHEEMNYITLGGDENKSGKTRVVPVPDYVKKYLINYGLPSLSDEQNIFSGYAPPYNTSYFNTAWTRIKNEMLEVRIIQVRQTLYSFRHTAAVNMYIKTKDPFKIQRAFGHSSLTVTLTYLRSLGLLVDTSIDDLPDSPV